MPDNVNVILQLLFRWIHVVAGITWIGHLYFFNWVNAHFAKTMDGPTKKMVVPELMPRALYWFRWGAAWTWITGVLLAGLVYYMGGALFEDQVGNPVLATGLLIGALVLVVVYDLVMKSVANILVANTIVLALFLGLLFALHQVGHFSGRALYIHAGAILGTVMAFNVWMRIWPNQKRIIAAIKEGTAPDAALVAMAGLRSRQNTFMSVPLVFFMISNHYATVYGSPYRFAYLVVILAVGFLATRLLYNKSAKVTGF
ncbi:MAG TPA: urate hydroxylase PuuD [Thermoanaerobaculia bacterium]|nr:urate hydroxylase PuuD [Thermoanaerobaculia bacterium]